MEQHHMALRSWISAQPYAHQVLRDDRTDSLTSHAIRMVHLAAGQPRTYAPPHSFFDAHQRSSRGRETCEPKSSSGRPRGPAARALLHKSCNSCAVIIEQRSPSYVLS